MLLRKRNNVYLLCTNADRVKKFMFTGQRFNIGMPVKGPRS